MINEERMKEFTRFFEEELFPTIVGEDGKGVERLRVLVKQRRIEVEQRKMERNVNIGTVGHVNHGETSLQEAIDLVVKKSNANKSDNWKGLRKEND